MHRAPPEHDKPRPLSQHDPPPKPATRNRPPVLLILIVVLVVTGLVVLHLTGWSGPAATEHAMSERATGLAETADRQITDLSNLLSTTNDGVLRSACPGREKLGDGTVAAVALHTADTYHRIASFARGDHAREDQPHQRHRRGPTENSADLGALAERLAAARHAVNAIADLTDQDLNTIPPAGAARFCDGQRTLEQILTRILKHQRQQRFRHDMRSRRTSGAGTRFEVGALTRASPLPALPCAAGRAARADDPGARDRVAVVANGRARGLTGGGHLLRCGRGHMCRTGVMFRSPHEDQSPG